MSRIQPKIIRKLLGTGQKYENTSDYVKIVVGGRGAPDEPVDGMRQPRIRVDPATDQAVYHCMTRVVNKERFFNDPAREIFRRQLWLVAEYCGGEVLTYVSSRAIAFILYSAVPQTNLTTDLHGYSNNSGEKTRSKSIHLLGESSRICI